MSHRRLNTKTDNPDKVAVYAPPSHKVARGVTLSGLPFNYLVSF
jgi:hypothetical protein